ncbi:DUF4145 domain-containing protein [Oceanobacillus saliphilus]|uniref:DUF4145 domain-containing protein n=1 Tax=Oceanobacillus saliphilus TaxID=2925834 RepID=UPI00201D827A|nr:DUF4145 domain-containing protein [Oceanobacillus saliphilus]
MYKLGGMWRNTSTGTLGVSYKCGYCGNIAGPSRYYETESNGGKGYIYICPTCNRPTYKNSYTDEQTPGPIFGNEVEHLPNGIEELYEEARNCIKVNAYTSSVLSCRKLLMNVSVMKGAEPGKRFAFYVDFLEDNHFIPPDSREWVDHIRKKGNEATHEIPSISKEDAIELLDFTEMLLRFVYEMPGKMKKHTEIE